MNHPASRVLAVLELLQAHSRLSGSELARRINVDVRTLRRYIKVLEDIGIPITAERGRYGAYSLVAGFKLPPMMFSDDEALAISIGLMAARGLGLADAAPAVASAQAKIERVMPPTLKKRVRAVDETVTLDLRGARSAGNNAALLQLSSAAQSRRRVHFDYRAADGADSAREFDAYGLTFRTGHWYVVGHCHLRGGLRSFRLDRIGEVRPLDKSFGRPEGFDAAAHLSFSIATLPRATAVEVRLKTDLAGAQYEFIGDIGVFDATDAGVVLRTRTDDLDWFARQLARLSCEFEIVSPPELADALARRAQSLARVARGAG
ncbi:helix-turn-helix transcriptional regulator [Tahibacter soli]|uniref:YafY family protein n=1 Tax=Tahibacter soli TaxID=2983605 RepID=A0A9X3YL52_9GAMM|nr:YafY family protein [Tahibacter soli]MDC8014334.1 YafY family protein [Tahibacter soli]